MKKQIFVEVISCVLILLFVYAATSKWMEYSDFKLQLGKSPFITDFALILAWVIPSVEIGITILLMSRTRTIMVPLFGMYSIRLIGLYASLFLMTLFTAYIFSMMTYSYYLPCSCGGVLATMTWKQHFWFNTFFTILSMIGILLETSIVTPSVNAVVQLSP